MTLGRAVLVKVKLTSAAPSHKEGLEHPSLTGKLSCTSNVVVSRSLPSSFTKGKVKKEKGKKLKVITIVMMVSKHRNLLAVR